MNLIRLLVRRSPLLFALSVLSTVAAAVLTLLLLTVISAEVSNRHSATVGWKAFSLLAFVAVAVGVAATLLVNRLSMRATRDLSISLLDDILSSSLFELERTGKSGVVAALVDDIPRVVDVLPAMVGFLRHCVFIVCCFVYLGRLSPRTLAVTLVAVMTGVALHRMLHRRGTAAVTAMARVRENLLHKFRDVVDGVKQLKLSDSQRGRSVLHVRATAASLSALHGRSAVYFIVGGNFAMLIFYALICLILFAPFDAVLPRSVVAAYALCLIMMLGPLQGLVGSAQSFAQGYVAFDRIEKLRQTLQSKREKRGGAGGPARQTAAQEARSVRPFTLDFEAITHGYDACDREPFTLGPLDLTLRSGEVVFIVGGNGSGKTTLAKLLVGLYVPLAGRIRLSGVDVDDSSREWYRRHFCAIFSDFCLFDSFARELDGPLAPETAELLRRLRLDHVVSERRGLLAQARTFSAGERRRVALVLAVLEDRPIYVFDEFAADQDPAARELFYKGVLPDLARRGKLVIVITHDTRYFDQADCIVQLERGSMPVVRRTPQPLAVVGDSGIELAPQGIAAASGRAVPEI